VCCKLSKRDYFVDQLLAAAVVSPGQKSLFESYHSLRLELQSENDEQMLECLNEALELVLQEWILS
jgi:hypothetical protein